MTQEIIKAGNPTATSTAAVKAEPAAKPAKPVSPKVMVLAVHQDPVGKIVITPIDVEHEDDDQSNLDECEQAHRLVAQLIYMKNHEAMMKALGSVYSMFDGRLYREKFRTFENFCFAIFGTNRISDTVATKAKARINQLKAALPEGEKI